MNLEVMQSTPRYNVISLKPESRDEKKYTSCSEEAQLLLTTKPAKIVRGLWRCLKESADTQLFSSTPGNTPSGCRMGPENLFSYYFRSGPMR